MKLKFLAFALACSTSLIMADFDIHGQITNIDGANHTITLNGNQVIKIYPYTELKGDDCGMFGNDIHAKFTDLKPGMFVEVDAIPEASGMLGAKEVEWKCNKMAY